MDERLSLHLHSINATLLMILVGVAAVSAKLAGDAGAGVFGLVVLLVAFITKLYVWRRRWQLRESPKIESPPLDVDDPFLNRPQ